MLRNINYIDIEQLKILFGEYVGYMKICLTVGRYLEITSNGIHFKNSFTEEDIKISF